MKAGFYSADITPPIGSQQPGAYGKAFSKGIHDPLKARAAVFDDGKCPIAFVGLDTCLLGTYELVCRIRDEAERLCGIPAGNIMLGASHTHAGGPLWAQDAGIGDDASDLVKTLARDHSISRDELYENWVAGQVVTAICEAYRMRQDAEVSISSGHEGEITFNRRIRMKSGRVYTHPAKNNPDNLGYAGPIDPEVGVVAAWTPDGNLLGCIVNFTCHCTHVGGIVSSDYVQYIEKTVQGALDEEAVVVFLQGAAGDITQFDNMSSREPEFGWKYARRTGTAVGAEAVRAMIKADRGEHAPLAAARKTFRIGRRVPSPERVAESRRIVEEGLRTGDMTGMWAYAKEIVILDYLATKSPEVEVEVQGLQIGDTIFVANQAEYFCALGLAIKEGSPFRNTYVVELANGCIGYVPTAEAFQSDGGGYETVLTAYSNLEVEAGNMLVNAGLEIARELKPGSSPAIPDSRTSQHSWANGVPWDAGVLGPQLG